MDSSQLEDVRDKLTAYRDIFGQPLLNSDEISAASTKSELEAIISRHEQHIEGQMGDALSSLSRLRANTGLTSYD